MLRRGRGKAVYFSFSSIRYLLTFSREINTSLQDTTAVSMCCYLNAVFTNGVVHKLLVCKGESMQALLNHMVSVNVLDQRNHIGGKRFNCLFDLVVGVMD